MANHNKACMSCSERPIRGRWEELLHGNRDVEEDEKAAEAHDDYELFT